MKFNKMYLSTPIIVKYLVSYEKNQIKKIPLKKFDVEKFSIGFQIEALKFFLQKGKRMGFNGSIQNYFYIPKKP